ncbi:MAG: shikimate dehydrogenase [Lachnospiraceae bacterium]|nr:shikimate dehydrogenase [Lachnospiraceae bacterium]
MNSLINAETVCCALLGHPVGHSLSPVLHNALAARLGVNMVYTAFDVDRDGLQAAIDGAYALGIRGLNITVPHKQAVMDLLAGTDESASLAGAANTLVYSAKNGGYIGYNTDMTGLLRAVTSDGISLKGADVVIIGAGGVARAVFCMCVQEMVRRVYVLNRTKEHAAHLCAEIAQKTGFHASEAMGLDGYGTLLSKKDLQAVCFQCTSVGMHPLTESMPVEDPAFFEVTKAVYDLIYRPEETRFLREAAARGAVTHNGLRMLLYQGVAAFEHWFDVQVTKDMIEEVYQEMRHHLTDKKTIILTGFMGSGKTTIARLLSEMLDEPLIDLDTEIEQRVKTTIEDIFAVRGEEAFRDIETRILKEIASADRLPFILSTGGGVPLREENRKTLRETGTVVYLKTSPEVVYQRTLGDDSRPLLQTDNPLETIIAMEKERDACYRSAADVTIVTDTYSPEEVADRIIKKVFSS